MRTSNASFNPRVYDDQLSPFGQKVLRSLIKQWNIERERNKNVAQMQSQRRHNHAQNRVITFGEDYLRPPRINQTLTDNSCTDNYYLNFGDIHAAPPAPPRTRPVPTSADVMAIPTPVPLAPVHQTHNSTRDDLITSVDTGNFCPNRNFTNLRCEDFMSNDSIGKKRGSDLNPDIIDNGDTHTVAENKDTERIAGRDAIVNWDNMFDTELLSDLDTTPEKLQITVLHNDEIFKINLPSEKQQAVVKQKTKAWTKKEKDTVKSKKVTNKRKIETQVTEAIPKKVKRAVENKSKRKAQTKNSVRSGDYTEAVTNWLNDVDPNNTVEDTCEPSLYRECRNDAQETNDERSKPEIVFERALKTNPTKKVIQAQLANKDGVMKFGKPKIGGDSIKETTGTFSAEAGPYTTREKNKSKEKKSKFVAPIKSQTAVTDVNYEMLELSDTLVAQYELDGDKKQEIVAVLLFSNGFCQLNEQYTEASCVPEGLLIHINEQLNFYLDGTQTHLNQIVQKVLHCNTVVCYDGKAIINFLARNFDLEFDAPLEIIDTKIAGALLDADSPPESFSQLQRSCGAPAQCAVASGDSRSKAAWYAARLRAVAGSLRERLREEKLWELFVDIEMKLVPIVAGMERRGVRVDVPRLQAADAALGARVAEAAAACEAAAPARAPGPGPGHAVQLHSAAWLRAVLYDELRLHTAAGLQVRHTDATGAKSTDETMLRALAAAGVHPLPALLLEYRRLHKAHATFVTGILNHVKDGYVKPVWEQNAAATGRLASSAPNLQTVPKAPLRLAADGAGGGGDEDDSPAPDAALEGDGEGVGCVRLRSVYVCAEGGASASWCVVAADWRHVEWRVFAHAANDAHMQRALLAPDLFARLAAHWLKKAEAEVTVAERERTKRLVYASLYGAGPRKLMDILDVDYRAATDVAGSFDQQFPCVRAFRARVCASARGAGGRVTSLCGRARRLPHLLADEPRLRAHAERQAVNFVIQGSAADVCKAAMVMAVSALRVRGLRAHLLLSVHDELVWALHRDDLPEAAEVIRAAMEGAGACCGIARLPVLLRVGRSWGELQPYTPTPTIN